MIAVAIALLVIPWAVGNDQLTTLAVLVPPGFVILAKAAGLYDRDEHLIHKNTLGEVPSLFFLATLAALLLWLSDGLVVDGGLDRPQILGAWILVFALLVALRALARRTARSLTTPASRHRRAWSADDRAVAGKKLKEVGGILELKPSERKAAEEWMQARQKDEAWLGAARKTLSEAGYPADVVDRYPPEQVLFYYLFHKSRVHHDEAVKWMSVPYWQAEGPLAELKKEPMDIEGKLTNAKWTKLAKCSSDTALRDINDLLERKILAKEEAGGRSTSYILSL